MTSGQIPDFRTFLAQEQAGASKAVALELLLRNSEEAAASRKSLIVKSEPSTRVSQ